MVSAHKIARFLLSIGFVLAGLNHFRVPEFYLPMIPPWLPWAEGLNAISGLAEIVGGIGILISRFRHAAAIGLILLMIAIFPANLHVALHGWENMDIPRWVLFARLPFQLVFIAWIAFSAPGLLSGLRSKQSESSSGKFPNQ